MLPTAHGPVAVDVLEVRQVELDQPSDDPGDRLHASSHAWAYDTATDVTLTVLLGSGDRIEVTTPVAEPGPLIAMKLQAVMNRSSQKQGTDLQDIVRLTLDRTSRPLGLAQIAELDAGTASDIALHVNHWLVLKRLEALRRIHAVGGTDLTADDLDLVAELLMAVAHRPGR